jgi:hypothetical protein
MSAPDTQFDTTIAISSVSNLPAPNTPPIQNPSSYAVWTVYVQYSEDRGLRGMVPQGPVGLATELVRMRTNVGVKVVSWYAQCWGDKAQLPHWDTQSVDEVLLHRTIAAPCPGIGIEGNQIWTASGCYVYQLQVPPGDSDQLTIATAPYDPRSISVNYLTANDFVKAFVGPSTVPSTAANLQSIGY